LPASNLENPQPVTQNWLCYPAFFEQFSEAGADLPGASGLGLLRREKLS
jgi:hypothetical protein